MLTARHALASSANERKRAIRQRVRGEADIRRRRDRFMRKAKRRRCEHIECKQQSARQVIATKPAHDGDVHR